MTSLHASAEHPLDRVDLRARVAKALDAFLVSQRPTLDGISEDIAPIAEAIAEFVDGGKRLRPAFCYWGWRAAGGADCDEIIAAAAALELLQACALVHDDVMDGSDRRRGAPSVHRKFALAAPGRRLARQPRVVRRRRPRSCSATCAWSGPSRCSTPAASTTRPCCAPSRCTTGCGSS